MNRHLCRGMRLDNGEWITGYYLCVQGKHGIIEGSFNAIIPQSIPGIDPTTVEPVRVKPVTKSREWVHGGIAYYCPSCDIKFHGIYLREGKVCGVRPFCSNCGQALDWAEGSAE